MRLSIVSTALLLLPVTAVADTPAAITVRAPDAFYDPPATLPDEPGTLIASQPLAGVTLPLGLRAWRIAYSTSVDDQTPAFAIATVFAPAILPAGPRPVITWAHGTTGLGQHCMPSLVSAPTEGIPARDAVVKRGWIVVATDYAFAEQGGPHPYLIGEGEARSALDATRAARHMGLPLDDRTVVWGHSQGGHSALWAGIVAPRYAPDVKVVGVAAIAPAANMQDILDRNEAVDKRLGPYVARSYSRFYPDVNFDDALRPEAIDAAREIVGLCGFFPPDNPQRIAVLASTFEGRALATQGDSAIAKRLAENTADGPIAAPVVVAQGLRDVVVPSPATDAFVDGRCAAGQAVEYWQFAELDHGSIVQPGTPLEAPLAEWTAARFAGTPASSACERKDL